MPTFPRPKLALVAALLLLTLAAALRAAPPVGDDHNDLLAHGSRQAFWFGVVGPDPQDNTQLRTQVYVRDPHTPAHEWAELSSLSGRAVSLADDGSRDTETNTVVPDDSDASGPMADAIALMDDGQWALVSDTGQNGSGVTIPGHGAIRALCNDADTLWAIGQTGQPTTVTAPTTLATTIPAASIPPGFAADFSVAAPTTLLSTPRWALFRFQRGHWTEIGPAPPGADIATADLSMSMLGSSPAVAARQGDRSIAIWQFAADLTWHPAGVIGPDPSIAYFKLLTGQGPLMLWTAPDKGPGSLSINGPNWSAPVPLKVVDQKTGDDATCRAVAVAFDRFRLLWVSGGKVYQQTYDMAGTPTGPATTITPSEAQTPVVVPSWFLVALVGLVTMVTLVAVRNRPVTVVATGAGAALALAPMGLRILSGLIDALPVLVAAMRAGSDTTGHDQLTERQFILNILAGLAIYVIHTFIGEMLFAASIGKFLTGLIVVDKSGGPPTTRQIILRGVTRIVEWPIMILIAWRTPLHQRLGDLLAGTTVVLNNAREDDDQETPPES
jgi:uncharacterized RDD family membrane protein YckC